jgi:NAD(P)-dependent dehydrogenase (short-subunit alcohol dehydrogenase family)
LVPSPVAGRVAVISGAGSGIGRALAVRLAAEGSLVALLDVNGDAIEATALLCARPGKRVSTATVDVSNWEAVRACAQDVAEGFGRVDTVFCVAGVIHTGDVMSTDPGDFEHVLRVNALGSFNTAKAFLPYLLGSSGRLVFVSSAFGLMAAPNYSAYCASKFAVRALAESLQQEMAMAGHGVQVSCAYPGGVKTGIMRRGRYAVDVDRVAVEDAFDNRIARLAPDEAAAVILRGVERGKRRILVGRDARAVSAFVRVAGGSYPALVTRIAGAVRQR